MSDSDYERKKMWFKNIIEESLKTGQRDNGDKKYFLL